MFKQALANTPFLGDCLSRQHLLETFEVSVIIKERDQRIAEWKEATLQLRHVEDKYETKKRAAKEQLKAAERNLKEVIAFGYLNGDIKGGNDKAREAAEVLFKHDDPNGIAAVKQLDAAEREADNYDLEAALKQASDEAKIAKVMMDAAFDTIRITDAMLRLVAGQ